MNEFISIDSMKMEKILEDLEALKLFIRNLSDNTNRKKEILARVDAIHSHLRDAAIKSRMAGDSSP